MKTRLIIACDPGVGGGIAWGTSIHDMQVANMPSSPHDIRYFFESIHNPKHECEGYLEMVNGYGGNQMGTSHSGFVFGFNTASCLMALVFLDIPVFRPRPQEWQGVIGLGPTKHLSKSQHKQALCARAQMIFPKHRITMKTADAALIFYAAVNKLLKP